MSEEWREGEGDQGMSRYGAMGCPVLALVLWLVVGGLLAFAAGACLWALGERDAAARVASVVDTHRLK